MKIIHCADIHIGSAMQNLSGEKAKIRKREIIDTFCNLASFAKEKSVDVVVIAGDLFDKASVPKSVKKEVLQVIGLCGDVDFIYLTGNHDAKISLLDDEVAVPSNLKLFEKKSDWTYFDYGDVCIAGFDIYASGGTGFYESLRFDKEKFNIAVLHGDLRAILLDRLKGKNIDYLALGDIHIPDIAPKKLDMRGVYGYCGCLEGRGVDESGERGFFLLDIKNGKMHREFINIAKRSYESVKVDITGLDTHTQIAMAIMDSTKLIDEKNIVRVELSGKYFADTQKDKENLVVKLQDRFFCGSVKDLSVLDMGSVDYENEISLRREFVELVKNSELSAEEKDKVIEYGIKAMLGEVIEI